MGSGGSKPAEQQHVFNADAPVRFSQNVVDSLQNSSETDSSRAQDNELKIQARVNSELKRLRDEQSKQLSDLLSKSSSSSTSDSSQQSQRDPNTLFAHLSSPFYHDSSSSSASSSSDQNQKQKDQTSEAVQKEIKTLREKLDARKKLDKPSTAVEKARENVIKCLRVNDRRPLDCYEEVEAFKAEVAKMERAFVEKVGR